MSTTNVSCRLRDKGLVDRIDAIADVLPVLPGGDKNKRADALRAIIEAGVRVLETQYADRLKSAANGVAEND